MQTPSSSAMRRREFSDVPKRLNDDQTVIDFVRITDSRSVSGVYEGICW